MAMVKKDQRSLHGNSRANEIFMEIVGPTKPIPIIISNKAFYCPINQRRIGGRKAACVIQSPIVKRIYSRPVTLQGWLQKRGSDGLMLWKKRWFVLSDYCLFYYKDEEEEVLLGSFVLASWIISPCTHKDKVYKKYSFKAEHNNMRTYYFATDNDIIMAKWLRALTMASLLQESPRPPSKTNNNQTNQNKGKGYHVYQQPPQISYTDGFNSSGRAMADKQPLYANAPPKPKRLNDGSTPDPSEEEARISAYNEETRLAYYDKPMNTLVAHGSNLPPPNNRSLYYNVLPTNYEKASTSQPPSTINDFASHYECLRTSYTVNQVSASSHPPRPRSVDFLEFEHKYPQDMQNAFELELITLPRRPKSSMSISTPKDENWDSSHWSEETYAKKMRESSMYVRPDNENTTGSSKTSSSQQVCDITLQGNDIIETDGTVNKATTSIPTNLRLNSVSSTEVNLEHNIFKRSASARLPEPDNEPYGHGNDDYNVSMGTIASKKIQQREESMKRLVEWKQRMLQSPLLQKHTQEIGEAGNPTLESIHRPQEIKSSINNCAYHHESNLLHSVDAIKQPELEKYSAHEHLYSTSADVQTYNAYQSHTKDPEVGHVKQVPQLMGDVTVSPVVSDKGEKEYHSSSEYPIIECGASFSVEQINSNKLSNINNQESEYLAVSELSNLTNDFPGPMEQNSTLTLLNPCSSHKTRSDIAGHEADEEWGLKLGEGPVVKEFSYHYVKNEGTGATCIRRKSNNHSTLSEMGNRIYYKFHESMHSPQTVPENYLVNEEKSTKAFKSDEKIPNSVKSKTLPIGIFKNMKNKKKIELDECVEVANLKWEQSYLPDTHDKRQVFSDTETLLYDTSSDVDYKDEKEMKNKLPDVSSDDDRDDEVAAVLAKSHNHSHACLPEPTPRTPIMMCQPSSSFITSINENSSKSNLLMPSEDVAEFSEENYMTMTPRKMAGPASPLRNTEQVPIGPPISNMKDSSKGMEECPYVEMTQTGNVKTDSLIGVTNHHYLNQDSKFVVRSTTFTEPRRSLYKSEFETTGHEPLYMEVNSSIRNHEYQGQLHLTKKTAEFDTEEDDLRESHTVSTTLPDILNTTSPLVHHGSRRSDSSDADDEASKDLDSIDAPGHPRFSLSDTFRPASYYLGSSLSERAIIALNSDHPDSSDSDLVSPPPIPACSPPLDDLDTSIDSTIIDNKDISLNSCKDEFHKSSISEEKFGYHGMVKITLPDSSNHLETGSSEEESLKSERPPHFMKRRPLSADILNCLGDFKMLDSPSSRAAVKDITICEAYQETFSKDHDERPNHGISSSSIKDTDSYNPYRKNEFSKNIKLFYYWNRHTPEGRVSQDSCVVNDSKDILMKGNYDNMTHNPENKILVDSQIYNCEPLDPSSVNNGPGSSASNVFLDDMSPYANTSTVTSEIQNNAPYYYSDLFKVDSKNSLLGMNKCGEELHVDRDSVRCFSEDDGGVTGKGGFIQMAGAFNREEGINFDPTTYSSEDIKYVAERQKLESPHKKVNVGHQYSSSVPDETRIENHQRSRSLEGLLNSERTDYSGPPVSSTAHSAVVIQPIPQCTTPSGEHDIYSSNAIAKTPSLPDHIVMENASTKGSVRHSRSLDHLDKKSASVTQTEAVYVNSQFSANKGQELHEQRASAEKEREKIRQWDLMSSAPSTASTHLDVSHNKDDLAGTASHSANRTRIIPGLDGHQSAISSETSQKPNWDLKVSAGDLLGRTHEELVLLLIQLRRQRAAVCKSMERCHREIESHACLPDFDSISRPERIQKVDELKSRLVELEKQYEKGKPLVNLVDNMVKLGALCQSGHQAVMSEKLEFNHKVQEQRILADERRDWERIRADHQDLQAKVEQLYRLDKLLQEESGTLHSLQEDKGVLERALGGLKLKLQGIHGNTAETEWYRRQQRLLERELSRVRSILALNSKKLEETVAENARLEQELVVLRQKLQFSRRTTEPGGAATAALESELCRVQLLVGNLLRQRQELSTQVRQLTEKSNSLSQQIWPSLSDSFAYYGEPTGYPEECLDGLSPLNVRSPDSLRTDMEDSKRAFGGSVWREKPQEIKTVRIVKRESERRQRDRDHRSGNIGIPLMSGSKRVIPEELALGSISEKQGSDSTVDAVIQLEVPEPPPTPGPRSDSVQAVLNIVRKNKLKGNMLGGGPVGEVDPPESVADSPQLSPVYLSEAARKIVEEVAWQGRGEKRIIPRERRRHHTVSGPSIVAPKHIFSQRGSRDDLDIERVLRTRLTTPDVVRSTLNQTDTSFTKETIDNILGAPGKIVIPERYVPESQPQLSKEEIMKRYKKAEAIRKMLCETTTVAAKDGEVKEKALNIKHHIEEEKRNREHLLQLSQILAQEVMEKSKIVASVNSPIPLD